MEQKIILEHKCVICKQVIQENEIYNKFCDNYYHFIKCPEKVKNNKPTSLNISSS